jgi:hypothetical protein
LASLQNAKMSSSMLWNRLNLGRRSSADIVRDKHKLATNIQAIFRAAKDRARYKVTLRHKAEEEAREVGQPVSESWRACVRVRVRMRACLYACERVGERMREGAIAWASV